MPRPSPKPAGFSLLELMVAVAILLVVSAVAFSFLMGYQSYYQSTALKADMHSGLRAATVLLEQEIGQAGMVSLTTACSAAIPASSANCPTLCPSGSSCASTGVSSSASAQAVPISSTAGIFKGEGLLIDTGAAQETVAVTAIGTSPVSVSGIFLNNHPAGSLVQVTGMFPQGILSPGQTGASSATLLNLIGDVIGDGNLYYVQYNCAPPTLTRSVTNLLTATSQGAAVTLLDNLAAPWSAVTYSSTYAAWSSSTTYSAGNYVNYSGTSYVSNIPSNLNYTPGTAAGPGCFQYNTLSVIVGSTYTFTTTVSVTLTVETSEIDPITKIQSTETKSFLNLVPRNILGGYNLAVGGSSSFFQPNPSANCTTAHVTC